MWNRLKSYIAQIEQLLQEMPAGTDWEVIKQDLLVQTGFFQHERLVHLLVTLSFAFLMVMFLGFMLLTEIWLLGAIFFIVFVLLIFYFVHYYRLENGVQKLYKLYDEINKIGGK